MQQTDKMLAKATSDKRLLLDGYIQKFLKPNTKKNKQLN